MTESSEPQKSLPSRPDLVLRIGFAGNRDLPLDAKGMIPDSINWLLDRIAHRLAEFAPGVEDPQTPPDSPDHILQFYSKKRPILRLVSGIAEGADTVISKEFKRRKGASKEEVGKTHFRQSAILPFSVEAYRDSRDSEAQETFDELFEDCTHVIVSDGPEKPYPFGVSRGDKEKESTIDKDRRAYAYRAQSELILRNCDLVITMADRSRSGGAGGTLETIREAQHFQLPVVHFDLQSIGKKDEDGKEVREISGIRITLIEPGEPFKGAFLDEEFFTFGENNYDDQTKVEGELDEWIKVIVAGPNLGLGSEHGEDSSQQHLEFLAEFFDDSTMPPKKGGRAFVVNQLGLGWKNFVRIAGIAAKWYHTVVLPPVRKWWRGLNGELKAIKGGESQLLQTDDTQKNHPKSKQEEIPEKRASEEALQPILAFRNRSKYLNYYYSDLYRGAFTLSYVLAVVAVLLAGLSLVIIGEKKEFREIAVEMFSETGSKTAVLVDGHGNDEHERPSNNPDEISKEDSGHEGGHGYLRTLAIIVALKLFVVCLIFALTSIGNRRMWNERAINYRYLAERLRPMFYLPLLGSFQPPAAGTAQYASRALAQGIFDWVFDAFVRALNPEVVFAADSGRDGKVIHLKPAVARQKVKDALIGYLEDKDTQRGYHRKTSRENHGLLEFIEPAAQWLSISVILMVIFDIVLICLEGGFHDKAPGEIATRLAPWAAFFTALVPAAVAALNGVRFQSECQRLSDRSEMMIGILDNHLQRFNRLETRMEKYQTAGEKSSNPHSWNTDVLLATEGCVQDLVRESAEWTVLYSKSMPEN